MKFINAIDINTDTLPAVGGSKQISIGGDTEAVCALEIHDASSPVKFYDFSTDTFVVGSNYASQFLKIKIPQSGKFTINVKFPSGGTSYTVLVHADVHENTQITHSQRTTDGELREYNVYTETINQVSSNTTVTFTPITTNTNNFESMPTSVQSIGTPGSGTKVNVPIIWTINSKANDTHGYGLYKNDDYVSPSVKYIGGDTIFNKINGSDISEFFYFQTTDTTNGAITASKEVTIDDLTDIGVGMKITAGTGLAGTPTILSINEDTKTLTLSSVQTIGDGVTLTFKASGSTAIGNSIGLKIDVGTQWKYDETRLMKTVRADGSITEATDGSSTTIALNGTRGISGGEKVTYKGLNVDNSVTNRVATVTLGATTSGVITVERAQNLSAGTKLYFYGSAEEILLTGNVIIKTYPSSNREIFLDLDQFINIGTQT